MVFVVFLLWSSLGCSIKCPKQIQYIILTVTPWLNGLTCLLCTSSAFLADTIWPSTFQLISSFCHHVPVHCRLSHVPSYSGCASLASKGNMLFCPPKFLKCHCQCLCSGRLHSNLLKDFLETDHPHLLKRELYIKDSSGLISNSCSPLKAQWGSETGSVGDRNSGS